MKGPLEMGLVGGWQGRWERENIEVEDSKAKLDIRVRSHDLQLSTPSSGSLHLRWKLPLFTRAQSPLC